MILPSGEIDMRSQPRSNEICQSTSSVRRSTQMRGRSVVTQSGGGCGCVSLLFSCGGKGGGCPKPNTRSRCRHYSSPSGTLDEQEATGILPSAVPLCLPFLQWWIGKAVGEDPRTAR